MARNRRFRLSPKAFVVLGFLLGIIVFFLFSLSSWGELIIGSTQLLLFRKAQENYASISKISMHEHFRVGGNMKLYLETMEKLGIERALFVPTGTTNNEGYAANMAELLELRKQNPGKIIAFATAYEPDPNAPAFLEKAIQDGAKGIKILAWLRDFYDNPPAIDGPEMYRIYEVARKYKVPLLIHYDQGYFPEYQDKMAKVLTEFPDVKIIGAHYCRDAVGTAVDLSPCAELLDRFPNFFVDLSMGGGIKRYIGYFDNERQEIRDFILKYQDRLFWGTDFIIDGSETENFLLSRMKTDFDMLEKSFYRSPFAGDAALHKGLNLPKSVLNKLYYENPQKFLSEIIK